MTTLQHTLINLTGYGNAEKQLRKAGLWQLTPIECLNNIPEDHCTDAANKLIEDAITQLEATA